MKKIIALLSVAAMCASLLVGCGGGYSQKNKSLDTKERITLNIAGNTETSKGLEAVAAKFSEKFPNVDIVYEFVQNYAEMLPQRLDAKEKVIDIFLTDNIQPDATTVSLADYAVDLLSVKDKLDLTKTHQGLVDNFTYGDTKGTDSAVLYAIPVAGEMRGMYVNKTLLTSLGISVPKNYTEFLAACEKLKNAGYMPISANPGDFGQTLLYPYVCSIVVNGDNAKANYDKTEARSAGVSELFREPLSRLYELVEKYYYDYNTVKSEIGEYRPAEYELRAKFFLNIFEDENGNYTKVDDLGRFAFMTGAMSLKYHIDRTAEEYDTKIDYEFILSPIGDDGGYAYLSPGKGIAVSKNSLNPDWALEFINFLFTPENSTLLAEKTDQIPNTEGAMDYILKRFPDAKGRALHLGQATFSYNFYGLINETIVAISKANNPKYMLDDGNGNLSMETFEGFMKQLEDSFQNYGKETTEE